MNKIIIYIFCIKCNFKINGALLYENITLNRLISLHFNKNKANNEFINITKDQRLIIKFILSNS